MGWIIFYSVLFIAMIAVSIAATCDYVKVGKVVKQADELFTNHPEQKYTEDGLDLFIRCENLKHDQETNKLWIIFDWIWSALLLTNLILVIISYCAA